MDHMPHVSCVDGQRQGLDQLRGFSRGSRSAIDSRSQTATFDELHREERAPGKLANLEDLHDIRVLQAGHCLRLRAKSEQFVATSLASRQNHLQCDYSVE